MPLTPRPETRAFDFESLDELEPVGHGEVPGATEEPGAGPASAVGHRQQQQPQARARGARVAGCASSEAQRRAGEEDGEAASDSEREVCGMDPYRCAVSLAVVDDIAFSSFKRNTHYRVVLEHVWPSLGAEYLSCIKRDAPGILKELEGPLRRNNDVGSPILHSYPEVGLVSPTQLRYLKVLVDLRMLPGLPTLDGLSVVEFGVGYGGQCQLILAGHSVKRYLLADFPEVELLAERYLRETAPAARLEAVCLYQKLSRSSRSAGADLFISNYAFSELRKSLQCRYFQELVQGCRRGYVTYNKAVDAGAMPVDEFAGMLRDAGRSPCVEPEVPYIAPDCWIVTW